MSRFDFQRYVDVRKNPNSRRTENGGFGEYAFAADLRVLRTLTFAKPVRLAAEASVRAYKAWARSDILGRSVRVTPRQYPRLYDLVADCARELHIPVPTTYVLQDFSYINASTFGTDSDSFILIPSATMERLSDTELKYVIGHECGHIQNSHVTYNTALHFLTNMTGVFVRWIVTPATLALRSWSRQAEITCDRAGLVCCKDVDVATKAIIKLAVGTQKLADEIDIEAYLEQLDDIRTGLGRVSEFLSSHPYLPKRLKALQLFAESDYYHNLIGESGGRPLTEIDKEVEQVVRVL